MTRRDNSLTMESVPEVFCWTKFGSEAGEEPHAIFERKEIERRKNGGVFLWGVGNSIRPSLLSLLAFVRQPEVLFSPMKAAAAKKDAEPTELVMWCDGIGFDGLPYALPDASLVTSRHDRLRPNPRHFALVCYKDSPLLDESIASSEVSLESIRNLKTGTPLGASQVTSVVRVVNAAGGGTRYPVVARARLVYPFLVRLTSRVAVPATLRLDRAGDGSVERNVDELVRMRSQACSQICRRAEQLQLALA